jgi:uncharacterized protein YjcR
LIPLIGQAIIDDDNQNQKNIVRLKIFIAENKTGNLVKSESMIPLNESLEDFEYENNNLFDKYFNTIDLFDQSGNKLSKRQKRTMKINYILALISHLKQIEALNPEEEEELLEYYKDIYEV